MNRQKLGALIRTSLRYANPQYTEKARKKGKSGVKLTRSLVLQFVFLAALFTVLYGGILFLTDFSRMPGYFTMYVGLFGILALSQGISVIYNVFFESKDLGAYLPLPFQQAEIFLSKILVVMLTVVPFVLPLLVLFALTAWQSGNMIVLAAVLGIVGFLLFLGVMLFLCALIVLGLTRTKLFQKHKKLMTTGLMVLSTGIAVVGVLVMQNSGHVDYSEASEALPDRGALVPFLPVYWAMNRPFSLQGLLGWAILIGVFLILALVIKVFFLPKLYEQLTEISTAQAVVKRKRKDGQSLNQLLRAYNLQLIKDPNLAMQVLSSSVMMPLVMLISSGGAVRSTLTDGLPAQLAGVAFAAGLLLSFLSSNPTSFVANIISLDRENYDFINTLPISKKDYLKQKFLVGYLIQAVIAILMAVVGGVMFKLSPLLIISLILGTLVGSFVMSLFYFARDHRLLLTNWTSVTQLFQRGGGTWLMVIVMFLGIFLGFIAIGVYAVAALSLPFVPLNILVVGGLLLICGGVIVYFKKQFWDKLDTLDWQRRISLNKGEGPRKIGPKKFR